MYKCYNYIIILNAFLPKQLYFAYESFIKTATMRAFSPILTKLSTQNFKHLSKERKEKFIIPLISNKQFLLTVL